MSGQKKSVHIFQKPENSDLDQAIHLLISDKPASNDELMALLEKSIIEKESKQHMAKANSTNQKLKQQGN